MADSMVSGLSSRLSYTFSRDGSSKQEDISGHTDWQLWSAADEQQKVLSGLVNGINSGSHQKLANDVVMGVIKYPLYIHGTASYWQREPGLGRLRDHEAN